MRQVLALLCMLGFSITGCGNSDTRVISADEAGQLALGGVGDLYRTYTADKKKPPSKLADFQPYQKMNPTGFSAIKSGEVVVRYGATLPDIGEEPGKGPGDEVLAYLKSVPDSGGQVLMLNRTIQTMTAEQFKSAKLAGTDSASSAGDKAKRKN